MESSIKLVYVLFHRFARVMVLVFWWFFVRTPNQVARVYLTVARPFVIDNKLRYGKVPRNVMMRIKTNALRILDCSTSPVNSLISSVQYF